MSETVFKQVSYDLNALIKYIELGEIGLPDIQHPFVWKNAKVRDLFDSMYKGYPVGYLLFWQNEFSDDARVIGTDTKQKPPRLLIVDGQQGVTAADESIAEWLRMPTPVMESLATCGISAMRAPCVWAMALAVVAASSRFSAATVKLSSALPPPPQAKAWRMDKYLRRLEAVMIVVDHLERLLFAHISHDPAHGGQRTRSGGASSDGARNGEQSAHAEHAGVLPCAPCCGCPARPADRASRDGHCGDDWRQRRAIRRSDRGHPAAHGGRSRHRATRSYWSCPRGDDRNRSH